ncbi:hypothetical protein GGP55_002675 [Salinibacter ruber]|uniref:hypothetical protein n=1 Tax=Salinibacter ruber TaxID=146919 RepID=UPI00216796EE|nr:hypothetical protein [Salinibacter ruber]MCS3632062.1 hypothetical protein [Salinibacter ruber]
MIGDALLERIRSGGPAILLDKAYWLVWTSERRSEVSAAMSSAQFVHFNAPVLALQRSGQMEHFGEDGELGWTSNLAWPRANLEMMRLPARASFSPESPPEEDPPEEDSADENASDQDAVEG